MYYRTMTRKQTFCVDMILALPLGSAWFGFMTQAIGTDASVGVVIISTVLFYAITLVICAGTSTLLEYGITHEYVPVPSMFQFDKKIIIDDSLIRSISGGLSMTTFPFR